MSKQAWPERITTTVTNTTDSRKVLNAQPVLELDPGERRDDVVMLRGEYSAAERTGWFEFKDVEAFQD